MSERLYAQVERERERPEKRDERRPLERPQKVTRRALWVCGGRDSSGIIIDRDPSFQASPFIARGLDIGEGVE